MLVFGCLLQNRLGSNVSTHTTADEHVQPAITDVSLLYHLRKQGKIFDQVYARYVRSKRYWWW